MTRYARATELPAVARARELADRLLSSRLALALLILALAVVARVGLSIDRFPAPLQADTLVYYTIADQIGEGNLFYRDVIARAPGYAWYVLAADVLPLSRDHALVLVQHIMGIALAVGVFLAGWRFFGRLAAVLAGCLVALSPAMIFLEDEPLPDFLFGFIVTGVAAVLAAIAVRGTDATGKRLLFALGALMGLAALVKPVGQILVLAPIPALLFAGWRGRRLARDVALVFVACVVVLSPWLIHSVIRFGSLSLSPQGGLTLFHRVYEVDRRPIPQDSRDGRLVARAIAEHPELRIHVAAWEAMAAAHGDSREALSALGSLARKGIVEYPFTFALNSVTGMDRFFWEVRSTPGATDLLEPRAARTGWSVRMWNVGVALSDIWWLVAMHGVSAVLALLFGSRTRRVAAGALASVWILVALGTVVSHGGLGRYSLQLAPVTWMLTAAGISALLIVVVRGVRVRSA